MAEDRAIFARGAIRAAAWLIGKPPGRYAMDDVLAFDQGPDLRVLPPAGRGQPSPETELEYGNPYQLLVAVTLSAQATDVGVNKATRVLFAQVETPADMIALGENALKERIKTIGLYNSKAKNVMAMAHQLVAEHDGRVPETREALTALPGVGRKTANVVLNTAFGHEAFAVDTHILRVATAPGLPRARRPNRSRPSWNGAFPPPSGATRITG